MTSLPGRLVLEGDQFAECAAQDLVGAGGAFEDAADARDDAVADLGRAAEQVAEDEQWQRLGVVAHQICLAAHVRGELADQVVGGLLCLPHELEFVDAGQAVGDGLAEPGVGGAVAEEGVGAVAHHGQGRAVLGDAALVQRVPAT